MTQDIEDCLDVVLKAFEKCDLPAAGVIAWCPAMPDEVRVVFITRGPLQVPRTHARAAAGR
jgi:hypothetical protein